MSRGFTLFELLICLAVMTALLSMSLPSFSTFSRQAQMTSLATSLPNFLYQAKSEAIFRHQDLWAHFILPSSGQSPGEWEIQIRDSQQLDGQLVMRFSGAPYTNINIVPDFSANQIKFDGVRGKIKNGSIAFYDLQDQSKSLKLLTSYGASRIRICGENGAAYGYPNCAS